jgi:hypothetical protein
VANEAESLGVESSDYAVVVRGRNSSTAIWCLVDVHGIRDGIVVPGQIRTKRHSRFINILADEFTLETTGHHEVAFHRHGTDLHPRQRHSSPDILRGSELARDIEHFLSSLEQGRPVHDRVVLHQIHVMLGSSPQQVPQLQRCPQQHGHLHFQRN